jgi:Mn-dependent DtxR family transcriptional regulator
MIGVEEDIANIDAEGVELHLHPQILKKLREFTCQRLVSSGIRPP